MDGCMYLQLDDDCAHLTLMKDPQIPQMQFFVVAGITNVFMGRHGQVFSLPHMLVRDVLCCCRRRRRRRCCCLVMSSMSISWTTHRDRNLLRLSMSWARFLCLGIVYTSVSLSVCVRECFCIICKIMGIEIQVRQPTSANAS